MAFAIKFWGVRGSIAVPSPQHIAFGGNTSCVEVIAGGQRVVLDAGTGIRGLGRELAEAGFKDIPLLLTHTHWDHITGFPFFAPAHCPDVRLRIRAGHLSDSGGIREVLTAQMNHPLFPVPLEALRAELVLEDFKAGESFALSEDLRVRTAPLNHPNGATGYRLEHEGRSICYVTDTEHVPGAPDENILALIEGADVVVYDATYTEEEFPDKVGWGHSTWNEGVRLCRMAGAKRMVAFHHEPDHDDAFMTRLEAEARTAWPGIVFAREGMVFEIA